MATRLPEGCAVEWAKYPERQDRLLGWLKSHSPERRRLFDAGAVHYTSKTLCVNMAAQAIFAQDINPANIAAVKKDPTPFGAAILSLFRTGWRPKYQNVIKAIGRTAARMRYEDFDANAKKVANAEMKTFPYFAGLHGFWRTLPEYNQFAERGESASKSKKRKIRHVEDSSDENDSGSDEFSVQSPKPIQRQPQSSTVKTGPPASGRGAKRMKGSAKHPTLAKTAPGNNSQLPIEIDSDEPESLPESSRRASTSNTAFFTRDQQFEKEIAELRLKTKEQELRAKEQEFKHEAFMALYGPPKV